MKKLICLSLTLIGLVSSLQAQDEGNIEKRERIARDKSIFFGIGPSFTLGKNIGDYSTGINFELGYTKRLNRVFSIGPSLSYLQFNYDPEKTGFNNIFIGGPYYDLNDDQYYGGAIVNFEGGDLSLVSLALNLKLNFVPVKDNSVVSVYAFAKPFVTMVTRTAVTGTVDVYQNYFDVSNIDDWVYVTSFPYEDNNDLGLQLSDKVDSGTEVTGGIFVGPGVEIFPAKKFSLFAQAAFGYTFPLTFVSTQSYEGQSLDEVSDAYPMEKKGFPSVNVQIGASLNF
jgi:hypothetical protein